MKFYCENCGGVVSVHSEDVYSGISVVENCRDCGMLTMLKWVFDSLGFDGKAMGLSQELITGR
jgi:uncharacterized Zn finger protein